MADERAKDEAQVAFDMARLMWIESDRDGPMIENSDEFLRLVARCVRSLRGRYLTKDDGDE